MSPTSLSSRASFIRRRSTYTALERVRSPMPSASNALKALGPSWMPAPISPRDFACSRTFTGKPLRASARAAARPPMPPPAMRMGLPGSGRATRSAQDLKRSRLPEFSPTVDRLATPAAAGRYSARMRLCCRVQEASMGGNSREAPKELPGSATPRDGYLEIILDEALLCSRGHDDCVTAVKQAARRFRARRLMLVCHDHDNVSSLSDAYSIGRKVA